MACLARELLCAQTLLTQITFGTYGNLSLNVPTLGSETRPGDQGSSWPLGARASSTGRHKSPGFGAPMATEMYNSSWLNNLS